EARIEPVPSQAGDGRHPPHGIGGATLQSRVRYTDGEEGGIRTLSSRLNSVSYRFKIANVAVNASDAVAPCTLLHARSGSNLAAARFGTLWFDSCLGQLLSLTLKSLIRIVLRHTHKPR